MRGASARSEEHTGVRSENAGRVACTWAVRVADASWLHRTNSRGPRRARQVAAAISEAARQANWSATERPLADGGEGTVEAFGGANRRTTVTGPLGATVEAAWRLDGERAVIEMAEASGLVLVGGREQNDPLGATTYGTGELIAAAVAAGARRVLVGVGGSATTDGGLGAVEALGWRSFRELGATVEVACDVGTCFVDAARVSRPRRGRTTLPWPN